ncbi:MAG: hypothetical protein HY741_28570 [Chloroflexi bacterium]|nr:hypothetical protein [Chloroflexota bacterium]
MESYTLTLKHLSNLPRTFILESDSIDRLLVNPGRKLLGRARMETAFEATTTWCYALWTQEFLPKDTREICSMTVLAEGIGHNLPGALARVLPSPQRSDNFMGVSRFALRQKEADAHTPFDAMVGYMRLHSPAPVWVLLDTVATGATLVRGLQSAFANAYKPREILLAAPAGSAVGMKRIAALCARENVRLTLFFFGAIFGLWRDGTALPWCHPDTILSGTPRSARNREITARLFNRLEGFCSVGDCSANFFDVGEAEKILREEEERFGWKLSLA